MKIEAEEENTKEAYIVAKIKRYRDKMKTDTDRYEQMKMKGNKKNMKKKKNDIAMLKEMRRKKREQQRRYRAKQKQTNIENQCIL